MSGICCIRRRSEVVDQKTDFHPGDQSSYTKPEVNIDLFVKELKLHQFQQYFSPNHILFPKPNYKVLLPKPNQVDPFLNTTK